MKKHLESGRLAKYFIIEYKKNKSPEDIRHIDELQLLTDKHILYVANVDDKSIHGNNYSKIVEEILPLKKMRRQSYYPSKLSLNLHSSRRKKSLNF